MKRDLQIWIGFVDGKPHLYSDDEYYDGVKHGEFYVGKRAAQRCYQDVRSFVIKFDDEE